MTDRPQFGEFCWNELMTGDIEKAKAFYSNLFGWQHEVHPMKNMTYTMFKMGEKMLGGMLSLPKGSEGMIPPHWMSYILVKDLDEMINKAQSLGATIITPKTVVDGFGQFALIQDPTGAYVSLWEAFNP